MKKAKWILAFLFSALMLMPAAARAASINGAEITSAPGDWTLTSSEMTDGDMLLSFDSRPAAQRAKSEITTSAYDFSGEAILLSFDSLVSVQTSGDKVEQSISLADGNTFNTNKLFSIKDGVLNIFGGAAETACSEDVSHRITLAVDPTGPSVRGAAWLDGTLLYSGEYTVWKSAIDLAAVRIIFRNNATASIADRASWRLGGFEMSKLSGAYSFHSVPADGQQMVSPEGLSGVTVYYGTRMSDQVYAAENYTLSGPGGAAAFEAERDGANIRIVPVNGFEDLTAYTLTIHRVTDLWGSEKEEGDRTVSFSTAYAGYTAPVVSVKGSADVSIFKGQRTDVEFLADKEIKRMEILCNGVKVKELTAAPYVYTVADTAAGVVRVTAVAYDGEGGAGYSPEVVVTTWDHAAPEVSVSGIEDGGRYSVTSLPAAEISASDDNGVKRIDVSIDGRLSESTDGETLRYSLSRVPAGAHVLTVSATDIYGLSASAEFHIEIVSDAMLITYTNDFETYSGDNTLPQDMNGGPQRGYLDAGMIDPEHGNSLLIGIDVADTSYTEANTAYVGVPMGSTSGKTEIEFEMNVSEKPADKYSFATKRTGGAQTMFLFITSAQIQLCNRNNSVTKTMEYEAGQWYTFRLTVDVAAHSYVVSVTSPDGTVLAETGDLGSGYDVLDHVRIFGPADDAVKSFVAIDNVVVKQLMDFPSLQIEGGVDYRAETVTVTASQALKPEDITAENVTLSDAFGEAAVKSVASSDGRSITIRPAAELRSSSEYKVTIAPNVRYSLGIELGAAVEGYFTTTAAELDILSGGFDSGRFVFTAVNDRGAAAEVTVIVQKWTEDGRVISAEAAAVKTEAGINQYSVPVPALGGGEYTTVYIWDGLVSPAPVSPQIWTMR